MSDETRTYRRFTITRMLLKPEGDNKKVPRPLARVEAQRGVIRIVEPQLIGGDWDMQVRHEIDRLLDPAVLRDVVNLN